MSDYLERAIEETIEQELSGDAILSPTKHEEKAFMFQEEGETDEEARQRAAALIAAT